VSFMFEFRALLRSELFVDGDVKEQNEEEI
jgi:hypothetical protein